MPDLYVTEEEGNALSFNYSFKQSFFRDPKRSHGIPEYTVITDFMKSDDEVRQIGMEILLYLRRFCFASRGQLISMLTLKHLNASLLDTVLDEYVKKYLLNYFTIAKYDMGEIPDDAFRVYCLDSGAIYILTHFSSTDHISWFSTDNVRSIELVNKYLATGMFYQSLAKVKGNSISNYMPLFDATIGRRTTRFSAFITIMNGCTPINYLLDTIRAYDLPGPWMKKVSEQMAIFSKDKYWQKYFYNEPNYLLLVEDKEQAVQTAEIFYRLMGNKDFRLITDKELAGGFDKAKLLRYVPESNEVIEEDRKIFVP